MKIKTGDNVKVIAGREKGKSGKVMQVFPKEGTLVVEKLNIRTRHLKARSNTKGQRVEFSAPFKAENVMLICPKCQKPTRITKKILDDGKKIRSCAKCKQQID